MHHEIKGLRTLSNTINNEVHLPQANNIPFNGFSPKAHLFVLMGARGQTASSSLQFKKRHYLPCYKSHNILLQKKF